jgi:deoxycytidylate deaminase
MKCLMCKNDALPGGAFYSDLCYGSFLRRLDTKDDHQHRSTRPSWDETCMNMVDVIRKRCTCYKMQTGALLFHPTTKEIVAIAYAGSPHGMPECNESEPIIEDRHHVNDLHAEDNLFMWAGRKSVGCVLYCNFSPCRRCVLECVQGRIAEFVYREGYDLAGDESYAREVFSRVGIGFRKVA